ncbi:MAG: hypothetical protein ABI569_04090 [Casimicrobiaceae bacterium]
MKATPCKLVAFAVATAAIFAFASPASALQQRSFVGSLGLDTNACTLAAPCRSFGSAIAQTLAGGEVIVLDSAGYGPVTIVGPISLIAPPGVYAGISVSSGTGITVNAGSSDVVVLRGLSINNVGAGTNGIVVAGGLRVMIDRCAISGFSTGAGIALTTSGQTDLDVTETLVRDSSIGVQLATSGILSQVTLSHVRVESNLTGVDITGSSVFLRLIDSTITNGNGDAIHINPLANRTVRFDIQRGAIIGNNIALNAAPFNANVKVLGVVNDVLVAENGSFGIYAVAGGAGSTANLSVTNCVIRYNGTGLRAQVAGATILSKNNLITDNGFDIQAVGVGAAMLTGLGNTLFNNGTPGAFTGTVAPN